jgi:UDP-3-O-acyl-N-acetylglucosamine deacetylase
MTWGVIDANLTFMLVKPLMSGACQTSIKKAVHLQDDRGAVRLLPSGIGQGIVFSVNRRVFGATPSLLGNAPAWGGDGLEHLLAAVYAASLDNVVIEIEGRLPSADSSAAAFAALVAQAGLEELDAPRRLLKIAVAGRVERADGSFAAVAPPRGHGLTIETVSDFPPPLGLQCARYHSARHDFAKDFAWARHGHDLPKPWLAPDEPARHEVIHVLAALALLPARLQGELRLYRQTPALLRDLLVALLPVSPDKCT